MYSFTGSLLLFAVTSEALSIEVSNQGAAGRTRARDNLKENSQQYAHASLLHALNLKFD